ncbi:hypothetical protein VM94_01370 [Janthinobacterium sp. KBS0711]|uniref:hypothetical protein n=1 Tax=Janthinobacterium sp. KBS0711 TaxID=1649647 RepID=UPI0006278ED3|nr:hypothetical protein [Janthinobacterium sp. KBS0711]KKO64666.1 hypothetical protein VM94_01370 [Janthinobacterium sp. KBS0711]TSD72372.1 hypothetical protein FFI39_016120 [Janthinobacterium sp. KBS0711]
MLKHTALSLAMALAGAAPFAHALDGTTGSSHSVAARMQAETSKAADPDAPAPLPVPSDISLAELERRLALGQAQAAEKHYSSALDPAALTGLARQMGCQDIVGIQPFGFPLDQTQPAILSGAHLLARCPDRAYVTITAMSMAGKTGKRARMAAQSFNQTVDGRPARRLYYKAPNGRQKETLTIVDGSYAYALEYWSLDDSQQSGMVGKRRMDTLTLPQQVGRE